MFNSRMREILSGYNYPLSTNLQEPVSKYREVTEERFIKRTTKTLVEDETLVANIVSKLANRWRYQGRLLTKADVNRFLLIKSRIVDLYLIDKHTESGYEEQYCSHARWENDLDAVATWEPRKHSFTDVLADFIELYPDLVQFEIKEEVIKETYR